MLIRVFRSIGAWNQGADAPTAAKVAAVVSLVLCLGVISCGRLLPISEGG